MTQLEGIIKQVQSTSEHVAASSEELYASVVQSLESNEQIKDVVGEVAAGSRNQLRSSGESVRGMEEMSGGAQQIAESTLSASDTSAKTLEEAEQGRRAIDHQKKWLPVLNKLHH